MSLKRGNATVDRSESIAVATGRALTGLARLSSTSAPAPNWECRFRGAIDATAARLRFSDPRIHPYARDARSTANRVRDALEQVRVEWLAGQRYPGCKQNLATYYGFLNIEEVDAGASGGIVRPDWLTSVVAHELASQFRKHVDARSCPAGGEILPLTVVPDEYLDRLASELHDQVAFARTVDALIYRLGLTEADADRTVVPPDTARDTLVRDDSGKELPAPPGSTNPTGAAIPTAMTSLPSGSALPGVGTIGSIRGTLQARHPDLSTYRAYTTAFDREIFAEQLCSREELAQLRTQMDTELARIQAPWIRLARRLQRRLLAQRKWAWAFDLESGLIDAAKLPRTVVDPRDPLCFKQEYPVSVSDTVVSLLIDCSGSMRGEPMLIAAASADLLARALERCGVKVEVLGFTTHGWRGGSVFRRWVADGRPSYPGRLAELRHIIFKAAAVPWRRARSPIAAMLRHDLLYENVDGEALLWAHRRLLTRPEQRRILIVVSDGAPAEDATTSTNSADYLARHLYDVTNWIEKNRAVELLAIGIRYSVKDFYRRSVQIQNTDELGSVLIEQLALRLT